MAKDKYRVAVVGVAHMHVLENWFAFSIHPRCEMVGWADVPPEIPTISEQPNTRMGNLNFAREQKQVVYDDYRKLLDEAKPDIVILCSENTRHKELACEIMERGINVVVEKPMATTIEDAREMAETAKRNNVMLAVNWPSTWQRAIRTAKKYANEEELGRIFKFTYKNASSAGPLSYAGNVSDAEKEKEWWHIKEQGGGAYLDYCCYGCNLVTYLLGDKPEAAWGMKANINHPFASAEDNGALVGQFKSGAFALLEGSWTQFHSGVSNGPVIYGLKGTMVVDNVNNQVLIYSEKGNPNPTKVIPAEPIEDERCTLAREVIHCLDTGDELHGTMSMQVNLDAMALLDAGIRSAASGKLETVK